jgi:hypothetical protein
MVLFNLLLAILRPLAPVVEIVAIPRMLLGRTAKGFAGTRPRMMLAGPADVQFVRDRGSSPLAATATAAASILGDSVLDDSASSATTIPDDDSAPAPSSFF